MIFAIECVVACVLFTVALEILCARRREIFINDYPPVVSDKLRDLNVVDWYDFLVVDILFAPFDKFYKMAKVSPIEKSAVWFHFKGSVKGMIIGRAFAPVVGLIVMLI